MSERVTKLGFPTISVPLLEIQMINYGGVCIGINVVTSSMRKIVEKCNI